MSISAPRPRFRWSPPTRTCWWFKPCPSPGPWPGLRVGYAIGDADLIEALTRVKDSFNSYPLGRPAQAGAIASLGGRSLFSAEPARVIEGRERLNRGLVRLGFEVLPSAANFVFARHPAHRGAAAGRRAAPAGGDRPPFFRAPHLRLSADHRGHGRADRPAVVGAVGHPGRRACSHVMAPRFRRGKSPACRACQRAALCVGLLARVNDLIQLQLRA